MSYAQKVSEGYVEYAVTYPVVPEGADVKAMMMPESMKLYFKNDLTRADMPTDFISTKTITNSKLQTVLILMDVHDRKMALPVMDSQINSELDDGPQLKRVEATGKKKNIAGYRCTEAWLHFETFIWDIDTSYYRKDSTKVFYTKNIGNPGINWNTKFKGLDGFLMEYELPQNDIIMRFTAQKVRRQSISNNNFLVPEGYEIKNQEEVEDELVKIMTELRNQ